MIKYDTIVSKVALVLSSQHAYYMVHMRHSVTAAVSSLSNDFVIDSCLNVVVELCNA